MRRRVALLLGAVLLLWANFLVPVQAETLSDGVYAVEYELLQGDSESVSIANDYFEKPALLKVDGDEKVLQLTLNHSKWVQELQERSGDGFADAKVIAKDEEADTRVIELKVDGELAEPFPVKMHVVIDELEIPYDHAYTVRVAVDAESVQETDQQWIESVSEGSKIWFYIATGLVIVVAVIVAIRLMRSKK
ncbi:NEAT domain-containing protein [Sporosarcina sp. ACRSL]|uniref:NEAT domain-containing protein n=1 Tax=Sporosarcina sp. ACRSL TaxID=2918215 RepID=UPI001EF6B8FB|nr:NEAT domain-containing protein [Sporosarcina sp. ACRSL]MCG7346452.1 NEAT domain-containing protein [Sporosarcina sp. ACRSL]